MEETRVNEVSWESLGLWWERWGWALDERRQIEKRCGWCRVGTCNTGEDVGHVTSTQGQNLCSCFIGLAKKFVRGFP